jgi:hypothetical protein
MPPAEFPRAQAIERRLLCSCPLMGRDPCGPSPEVPIPRRSVFKMRIEVHRIENAEHFFANLRARACRAADHLFIEDAAVDPPQEHKIGDGRHVNASREEIDRDRDLGTGIIAERADQCPHVVHAAGDFLHGRVVNLTIFGRKGLFYGAHHNVRVGVGRSEDAAVGEIGDSDSSPLARNVRRTGMVVGRVVDCGGERQYGAEVHSPVGWAEISRDARQDKATAAASGSRPSR